MRVVKLMKERIKTSGIRISTGNPNVRVARLDLSDRISVRQFATDWPGALHILVNNAGIMALPKLERSPEGWELQFATNFLGHFALTLGPHNALAAAGGARIVSVSSSGSLIAPVIFDDLHFNLLPYEPFVAYGQSKTACVLLAAEATRRWADEGIFANALNPGAIATNLQKHTGGPKTPRELRKTPQQGAATSVLLATSPLLDGLGGRYFENCNEAAIVSRRPTDFSGGVAPYAVDPANAERLWNVAMQLVQRPSFFAEQWGAYYDGEALRLGLPPSNSPGCAADQWPTVTAGNDRRGYAGRTRYP
jgi:NAD(P)-dependent dehydrogenase (short-subunit alcohol dehydrogenase family)